MKPRQSQHPEALTNRPQRDAEPQTPHIHPPEQTLSEYEDAELFQLYLNGRDSAYAQILQNVDKAIAEAQKSQETYPGNHLIWTLAEGQIEGLKEILKNLKQKQTEGPKE